MVCECVEYTLGSMCDYSCAEARSKFCPTGGLLQGLRDPFGTLTRGCYEKNLQHCCNTARGQITLRFACKLDHHQRECSPCSATQFFSTPASTCLIKEVIREQSNWCQSHLWGIARILAVVQVLSICHSRGLKHLCDWLVWGPCMS